MIVTINVPFFTGYQTAYSQLAYAGKKERDPFSDTIPDAKIFLAQSLQKLSAAHPGEVGHYSFMLHFSLADTETNRTSCIAGGFVGARWQNL